IHTPVTTTTPAPLSVSADTNVLAALAPDVRRLVARLAEAFAQADRELYLVGGLVRDALLGATTGKDLDFTTDATPPETERLLRTSRGTVFKIGEKFGT